MKKIHKTLGFVIGFGVSLLLVTLVINLPAFDEDLLPEVKRIKSIQASPYEKGNAYPAMLAISNDSEDFVGKTEEFRKLLNQKINKTGLDFFNAEEYDLWVRSTRDKQWQSDYPLCNSIRQKGCMADLFEQLAQTTITNERLISQLGHYQHLIEMPDFAEATQMDFESPIVAYGPILALKRLYLADSFVNNTSEQFIQDFTTDMKFWRMVLEKGHLMITKMVAVASINNGIAAMSEAINTQVFTPNQLVQIQQNLQRLNDDEKAMAPVFEYEFKGGIQWYEAAEQSGEFKYLKVFDFFQLSATHNMAYLLTKPLREMAELDAKTFHQFVNSEKFSRAFERPFKWSPTSLYNPTGKLLMVDTLSAYSDYIARIHDLDGMLALLNLQIESALKPQQPTNEVVAQSVHVNPYTLNPFSYDSSKHKVFFECMDKRAVCELALPES